MTASEITDDSLADIQPSLDKHVIVRLALMQDLLIARALNLATRFKDERSQLQTAAIKKLPAGTKLPASTFASISLDARYHKGSLEIRWKKVSRRSRHAKSIFHDLRRNARAEYSAFELCRVAQEWEQDLVLSYEQRARLIRKRWSLVCKCLAVAKQIKRTIESDVIGQPIERLPGRPS